MDALLKIDRVDERLRLTLQDDVSHRNAARLHEALRDAFAQDARDICVDLAGHRIDAAAAATLLDGAQWAQRGGGRFHLAHVSPEARALLRLYRLEDMFDIDAGEAA
ncbi:MAG: anti-sigma factor antagonist [Zetaproteobacteria bacterium]|nr:MAG: anti-sigma factor antagonist [Zetaproteobacteria bacterium]